MMTWVGDLAGRHLKRHLTEEPEHFGMLFALEAQLQTLDVVKRTEPRFVVARQRPSCMC
jgi:hypothetical protein